MTQKKNGSGIMTDARSRTRALLSTFFVVFFVSFSVLDLIGMTPNPSSASTGATSDSRSAVATTGMSHEMTEEPVRIIAEKIGLDEGVLNPASADIETLDAALLKGVVRYPGSALMGQDANMLLFAHSSYLTFVHNSNYKAFNDIQKLAIGDFVKIRSRTMEYRYRVTSVRVAEADETMIDLTPGTRKLTLSTCDSFGTKSQRFVVEAEFIASSSL